MRAFLYTSLLLVLCCSGCQNNRAQIQELESRFAAERELLKQQIASLEREIVEKDRLLASNDARFDALKKTYDTLEKSRKEFDEATFRTIEEKVGDRVAELTLQTSRMRQELDAAIAKQAEIQRERDRLEEIAKINQTDAAAAKEQIERINRTLRETTKYRLALLDRTDKRLLELAIAKARNNGISVLNEREAELMAIQGTIEYAEFAQQYFEANPPK